MEWGLLLVFFLVFLATYFVFARPKNLPPGPVSLPIIGSLGLLRELKKRSSHFVFQDAAKEYGDIFSFRFGSQLFVVLNGFDTVNLALVKHADSFSGRPNFLPNLQEAMRTGKGIILENFNPHLKAKRRFTLHTLRDFGVGKTSLEEKINDEVNAVSRALVESNGRPVNMAVELLQKAIGNIIYAIIFGTRFDFDSPEFKRFEIILQAAIANPGALDATAFLPRVLLLLSRKETEVRENSDQSAIGLRNLIYEQLEQHQATYDPNTIRDFVDLCIQSTKAGEESKETVMTKGDMMRVIMDLFLAGSETTSTALNWAFVLISEFPDVQAKCQKEIDEVFGSKQIEYADRTKLPYVEATLREVQRYASIVPLSLPHCNAEEATLAGYTIPKDTILLPNIYSASRDPAYWHNPEAFDPSRFLDSSGQLLKTAALIPFSVGPRVCLGEPLARMELFLIFTTLLQRFTFRRENENQPHSLKGVPFKIINAPEPYHLKVAPRT